MCISRAVHTRDRRQTRKEENVGDPASRGEEGKVAAVRSRDIICRPDRVNPFIDRSATVCQQCLLNADSPRLAENLWLPFYPRQERLLNASAAHAGRIRRCEWVLLLLPYQFPCFNANGDAGLEHEHVRAHRGCWCFECEPASRIPYSRCLYKLSWPKVGFGVLLMCLWNEILGERTPLEPSLGEPVSRAR